MAINYYAYKAKMLRVVDGDTIDVQIDLGFKTYVTKRVRFHNIDVYETYGAQTHPLGFKAKEFVIELFAKYGNDFILLSHGDDADLYNRIIGSVYWDLPEGYLGLSETLKASGFDKNIQGYVEGAEPKLIFEQAI